MTRPSPAGRTRTIALEDHIRAWKAHGTYAAAARELGCSEDLVSRRIRAWLEERRAKADAAGADVRAALRTVQQEQEPGDDVPAGTDWRSYSACLDEDPELFFPIGNSGPAALQIEEAKAICHRCLVVDTCREWALSTGEDHGVWGALSEDERRTIRSRRADRTSRRAS